MKLPHFSPTVYNSEVIGFSTMQATYSYATLIRVTSPVHQQWRVSCIGLNMLNDIIHHDSSLTWIFYMCVQIFSAKKGVEFFVHKLITFCKVTSFMTIGPTFWNPFPLLTWTLPPLLTCASRSTSCRVRWVSSSKRSLSETTRWWRSCKSSPETSVDGGWLHWWHYVWSTNPETRPY